jgi:hypothetical protein
MTKSSVEWGPSLRTSRIGIKRLVDYQSVDPLKITLSCRQVLYEQVSEVSGRYRLSIHQSRLFELVESMVLTA